MLLFAHIIIALASVAYTTYLFIAPTSVKFSVSYALIGLTLVSGTALVITSHSPLLSSCEAGLAYIGVVLFGIIAAKHRLASIRIVETIHSHSGREE